MYIWLYWENMPGRTMPPYMELCYETIRRHCGDDFEVVLTTPENIRDYIPDAGPFEKIKNPHPAIRADFIRVSLLEKYGGIWMDLDIVVLKNFAPMKKLIRKHGFVGFRKNSYGDNHIPVWIFMSEPEGKVITAYKNRLEDLLARGRRNFYWSELGAGSLTPVIRRGGFDENDYILLPEKLVSPIPWQHKRRHFSVGLELDSVLSDDTMAFMLFDNQYPKEFKALSKEEVLSSNILIAKLLRLALGV